MEVVCDLVPDSIVGGGVAVDAVRDGYATKACQCLVLSVNVQAVVSVGATQIVSVI